MLSVVTQIQSNSTMYEVDHWAISHMHSFIVFLYIFYISNKLLSNSCLLKYFEHQLVIQVNKRGVLVHILFVYISQIASVILCHESKLLFIRVTLSYYFHQKYNMLHKYLSIRITWVRIMCLGRNMYSWSNPTSTILYYFDQSKNSFSQ